MAQPDQFVFEKQLDDFDEFDEWYFIDMTSTTRGISKEHQKLMASLIANCWKWVVNSLDLFTSQWYPATFGCNMDYSERLMNFIAKNKIKYQTFKMAVRFALCMDAITLKIKATGQFPEYLVDKGFEPLKCIAEDVDKARKFIESVNDETTRMRCKEMLLLMQYLSVRTKTIKPIAPSA